jgi:hypothetical protein
LGYGQDPHHEPFLAIDAEKPFVIDDDLAAQSLALHRLVLLKGSFFEFNLD